MRWIIAAIISLPVWAFAETPLELFYDQPAVAWEQALPVGNGHLGAMVFGGIDTERLQLNDNTLWSGGPQDSDNPAALAALPKIRELLFAGKYAEAQKLTDETQICKKPTHGSFGSYSTLGTLELSSLFPVPRGEGQRERGSSSTNGAGDVGTAASKNPSPQPSPLGTGESEDAYRRSLDLRQAIATVTYTRDGVTFTRQTFANYPADVIVSRLVATHPGSISCRLRLSRPERATVSVHAHDLILTGQLSADDTTPGMKFAARVRAIVHGGLIEPDQNDLIIRNADDLTLLIAADTDYRDAEFAESIAMKLNAAEAIGFDQLRQQHLADYGSLFSRVSLDLGHTPAATQPTDVRLVALAEGHADPALVALYFQYGRYLLISSSRTGLPANLQGLWSKDVWAPWNADYHTNINVQMNYWPAETTNLAECVEPLTQLIERMVEPGTRTAKVHYGSDGWTVHTIHNVWGFTSPGEKPLWGLFPLAGPWLCQHLWEHYAFSGDVDYLRRVWPVLRGSATFLLDWLVIDPHTGKLVSGPANSPENTFVAPDGSKCPISMGPTMDQEIAFDFLTHFVEAAKVLKVDDDLVRRATDAKTNLLMPKLAADGRLMEWAEPFAETEPHHRHVSHLFGLFPGSQIDPLTTPDLATAARKTLESRGDESTGWSMAWKICFWARLHDGDHAYKLLSDLLHPTGMENTPYAKGPGVFPNLFCSHPPFQIDGNFGGTAGIAEMLLQSHDDTIDLLPALPTAWPDGEFRGLCARGGITVDLTWHDARPQRIELHGTPNTTCHVRWRDTIISVTLSTMGNATLDTPFTP